MRKVFSYFVLALCLLVSTQVKAVKVAWDNMPTTNDANYDASVTIGDVTKYCSLTDAFAAAVDVDTATIKLLQPACDVTPNTVIGVTNGTKIGFDLNGKTVTFTGGHIYIENGNLNITGEGNFVYVQGSSNHKFLQLKGSADPKAKQYSVVTFGPKVNADMYGYLAQIDDGTGTGYISQNKTIQVKQMIKGVEKTVGAAYGAEIHVYCFARTNYGVTILGNIKASEQGANLPLIYVHKGATLVGGVYCAGYGIYKIEGATIMDSGILADECSPIYVKAGIVEIIDSKLIATADYLEPTPNGSGAKASGSAIVIDSHAGYENGCKMDITISGDCEVVSSKGYAVQEVVTDGTEQYADLKITGGNFVGGEKGTISVEPEYETYIKEQGSIKGGIYDEDITKYVNAANTVITYTDTEEGQKWTLGAKPSDQWKTTLATAGEGDYVQLNSATPVTETVNVDKKIAYLAILNANKVVVEGATLRVGEIVINADAQLVIKADAKVIVEGKQGIISTANENLIVEADAQSNGQLLINPLVTFNTTPRATVELTTRSFVDAPAYLYERVAIPFGFVVDELSCEGNVETYFEKYNYDTESWQELGFLNRNVTNPNHTKDLDVADLNDPFVNYQFLTYNQTPGVKYTFKGKLVGNTSKEMPLRANFWNGFGNSYVAEMDVKTLLDAIEEQFSGSSDNLAIYYYKCVNEGKQVYEWKPVSEMNLDSKIKLRPMEVFLIKNDGGEMTLPIDYKTMIWDTKAE